MTNPSALAVGLGGTCTSLPVVYVAVGRRLGYPLKLVYGNRHLFARWDDPGGERFNIECTSRGVNSHPDDYYLTWPVPTSVEEARRCGMLRSLSPRQELAWFLCQRGHVWTQHGRDRDAAESYLWAAELDPASEGYAEALAGSLRRWKSQVRSRLPAGFPAIAVRRGGRIAPAVPKWLEDQVAYLLAAEMLLNDGELEARWWRPLRERPERLPADLPLRVTVTLHARTFEVVREEAVLRSGKRG